MKAFVSDTREKDRVAQFVKLNMTWTTANSSMQKTLEERKISSLKEISVSHVSAKIIGPRSAKLKGSAKYAAKSTQPVCMKLCSKYRHCEKEVEMEEYAWHAESPNMEMEVYALLDKCSNELLFQKKLQRNSARR